jgi:hypothetical protein
LNTSTLAELVAPAKRRQLGIFTVSQPNLNVIFFQDQVLVSREVRTLAVNLTHDQQTGAYVLHPDVFMARVRAVGYERDIWRAVGVWHDV